MFQVLTFYFICFSWQYKRENGRECGSGTEELTALLSDCWEAQGIPFYVFYQRMDIILDQKHPNGMTLVQILIENIIV